MMVVIGFVGFGKRQSDLGRVGEKKMRFGGKGSVMVVGAGV